MPILSRWRTYLEARLREVFGDRLEEGWFELAARVLEMGAPDTRTPRSINVFVNQAAALWLQWRDQPVSFASIAYYLANRSDIENNAWIVLKTRVPWMEDFDPDWAAGVAALRYGVEPAAARQILIDDPARRALQEARFRDLPDLARVEGFAAVFQRIIDDVRFSRTEIPWAHAVLGVATLSQDQQRIGMWRALVDALTRLPQWTPGPREVQALRSALEHAPPTLQRLLLEVAKQRLEGVSRSDWDPISADLFVSAAQTVIGASRQDGDPGLTLTLPGDAKGAVALLSAEKAADLPLTNVSLRVAGAELEFALAQAEFRDSPATLVAVSRRLAAISVDFSWQGYARAILTNADGDALDLDGGLSTTQFFDGLSNALSNAPKVSDFLRQELPRDAARQRLKDSASGKDDGLASGVTFCLLAQELLTPEVHWETLVEAETLLARVEDRLAVFAPELGSETLIDFAGRDGAAAALVHPLVARRMAHGSSRLDLHHVVANLDGYLKVLTGKDRDLLWLRVGHDPAFWQALRVAQADTALPLALEVLNAGFAQTARPAALTTLSRLLARADTGLLVHAIRHGGAAMEAIDHVTASPTTGRVGGELPRALAITLHDLLANEDRALGGRWFSAARVLATASRGSLYRGLRRRLASAGVPAIQRLLEVGGGDLLTEGLTPRDADLQLGGLLMKAARDKALAPIFATEAPAVAAWGATGSAEKVSAALSQLGALIPRLTDDGWRGDIRKIEDALGAGRRARSSSRRA